jgi:dTMP kinase
MSKIGKFIVVEGVDGAGKSTQIPSIMAVIYYENKTNNILLTREPTYRHQEIRKELQKESSTNTPAWYASMFTVDRESHVKEQIVPSLEEGTHVVCDRYYHSTLVYQSVSRCVVATSSVSRTESAQSIPFENLWELQKEFPVPDLTLILDCPIEEIFKRKRGALDSFDRDFEFQKKLRVRYLEVAQTLRNKGHNIEVIDTNREISLVTKDIIEKVRNIL